MDNNVIAHECISIHTPAKGVTLTSNMDERLTAISIHTPAKGVTKAAIGFRHHNTISIHTPAKGVTIAFSKRVDGTRFISIHTPAKGVTTQQRPWIRQLENFNPHSRKGSDACPDDTLVDTLNISIHTPAKGVTPDAVFNSVLKDEFQSTLPQRE